MLRKMVLEKKRFKIYIATTVCSNGLYHLIREQGKIELKLAIDCLMQEAGKDS